MTETPIASGSVSTYPSGALASVEQVTSLLEEPPTEDMLRVIRSGLQYASDLASDIAGIEWVVPENTPSKVQRIIAFAVARWIRNPDGFQQNRAGDETLAWFENKSADPGEIYFTSREIERLQSAGAPRLPAFGSIGMDRSEFGPAVDDTIWAPTTFGRYGDFPLASRSSTFGRWLIANG